MKTNNQLDLQDQSQQPVDTSTITVIVKEEPGIQSQLLASSVLDNIADLRMSYAGQRKKVGMAFNAGGIRGYMSALVAQQLERDMGLPLREFVDVFSGVSIGCILSSLFAVGVSADAIVNLFETQSAAIFKPKFYYKWGVFPVKGPRYCSDSLYATVHSLVGDTLLKGVNSQLIGLATDMTDSSVPQCTVFNNIQEQYQQVKLVDMMMASSAAPSYFAQYEINGRHYVDGGVSNCDPSLQCIAGLQHQTVNVFEDSILINIGTGVFKGDMVTPDNKSTWNTFYLTHGLVASLTASQSLTHTTAKQLYQKTGDFFTLDSLMDQNIAMDDITALPKLKLAAEQIIASESYKSCIQRLKQNQKKSDLLAN